MTQSWLQKKMEEFDELLAHSHLQNGESLLKADIQIRQFILSLLQDFAKEVRLEEKDTKNLNEEDFTDEEWESIRDFNAIWNSAKRELDEKIKRLLKI